MEVHLVHFANFAKPQTVSGKFMTHCKQTYLIILISALINSCNNMRQENVEIQNIKQKDSNCLIDNIGKNDTLCIYYSSQGCFHSFTEELRIYRKPDNLIAELTTSMSYSKELLPPLTQYLNDSSIFAYTEFEKNCRTLKTGNGCTTIKNYIICNKTDSIKFKDNGCEFNGYNILKIKIYGQTKIDNYYEKIYR